MSSGRGSVSNNETGQEERYRGSKAALNMFMRSFAAHHAGDSRTQLLMAPGWVRTDLGGPEARLSIQESVPNLVNTMGAQGEGGPSPVPIRPGAFDVIRLNPRRRRSCRRYRSRTVPAWVATNCRRR